MRATGAHRPYSTVSAMPYTNRHVLHLLLSRGLAGLGAAFTAFGLDVWVYQQTGSYAVFASLAALAVLPPILCAPIAGYITDRFSRSKILFWCEILSLTGLGIGLLLIAYKALVITAVAALIFSLAAINEFRYTAMTALLPEVATRERLVELNGFQVSLRGLTLVSAPLLGAVVYEKVGLPCLFVGSMALGGYALVIANTISRQSQKDSPSPASRTHFSFRYFLADYRSGFKWLRSQPALTSTLLHFTVLNGFISLFGVINTPRILDAHGTYALSVLAATQGGGLLLGGVLLARTRFAQISPRTLIKAGAYALGLVMMTYGAVDHLAILIVLSFLSGTAISILSIGNQSLWQSHTPKGVHGKVIAIRSLVLYMFVPFVLSLSAPASDILFSTPVPKFLVTVFGGGKAAWMQLSQVLIGAVLALITLLLAGRRASRPPNSWRKKRNGHHV